MAMTPKQDRNGVPGPSATHNSAVPGPDATATISAAMGGAEAMGQGFHTATVFTRPADRGGVVDWETGVAGHEMPGEA